MMDRVEVVSRNREEGEALLRRSWHLAGKLARQFSLGDLRTGRWFTKLLSTYLRHYEAHALHTAATSNGTRSEVTEAIIHRACMASFLSGAGSGSLSTSITTLGSDAGIAGMLVALPASGLVISTETVVRSIIRLRMTCDLASAFGVRFDPKDPSDLSRLYAIIHGREEQDTDRDTLGLGRVERLVHEQAGDLGEALGAKLLGASVVRGIVPFLNVVTASVANWRHTRHVGDSVLRYVRLRRALEDAYAAVRRVWPEGEELLLESAWFLFISDGRLREEESAVLIHLLGRLPRARRRELMGRMVEDASAWLAHLRAAPARAREVLLWSLQLLSAADLAAPAPERHLLRRAAEALGTSLHEGHLDSLMHTYRMGGVAPPFAAPPEAAAPRARKQARKKAAKGTRPAREAPAHLH